MQIDFRDFERIDEKIRALASSNLRSGRPYLLSQLGKDVGDDLRLIKIGAGLTLAQYIEQRLADDFSLVSMGSHSNVRALVPAHGDEQVAPPQVAESRPGDDSGGEKRAPRYHYRFWAAFSVPLVGGRRWLSLEDLTFKDDDASPEGDYREVPAELIPPADVENRDNIIKANIAKWLEKERLPEDRFVARAPHSESRSKNIVAPSVMDIIIETLDRRQLAATTLSLDVVADLMRRRG